MAQVFASSPYRHYRLCLQQQLTDLWREHGLDERIVPVAYGDDHDDLAPFLQRLVAQPIVEVSASQATSTIWNVSLPPNPYFTGREELLNQLHRDASTARSGAVHCQVMTGLAGIGKTQLAVEYAYRHRDDYDVVWWIRSEDPITLIRDYAALAPAIGLAESAEQDAAVAGVRAWLEGKGRWLLIFDNIEDPASVARLLPRSGGGHVLLTSRAEKSDTAAAGRLADALGRLPLALEQAGGSIAEAGIFTFAQYLDLFQERSLELLNRGQRPPDYEHTIGTTWTVAVSQLRQQAPAALDLLCLGAFLAPEELPSQLLTNHADMLPASLAASAGDPLALAEVVRAARRYSLVRATGGSLTLHRLLQIVIRDGLNPTDQGVWAGAAVRLLRAGFPDHGEDVDAWPGCRQLLPHALAAIEHGERLGVELDKVAWLLDRVARYATGRAQYSEARAYLERSLRLAEAVLGSHDPEVAITRSDLGVVLSDLADYAGAKAQLEQALPTIEAALGPSHPETAIRRGVLGSVLRDLGDYAAAKAQIEQALAINEAAYGPTHPKVALRRANLGVVLRDRGNLMAARAQFEMALNIARASLGDNHPTVVWIRDGLNSVFPGSARPKRRKGSAKRRGRRK